MKYQTKEAVIQNLTDAGCDQQMIGEFFYCLKAGDEEQQIELLTKHRKVLLESLHQTEKRIDCLDYLVYQIQHYGINHLFS